MRIKKMTISGWKSFDNVSLELGRLNVIVGRNNSGKSALLRAAQFLQPGTFNVAEGEIRLGSDEARVEYALENLEVARYASALSSDPGMLSLQSDGRVPDIGAEVRLVKQSKGQPWAAISHVLRTDQHNWGGQPTISPAEPGNYIYPYFRSARFRTTTVGSIARRHLR